MSLSSYVSQDQKHTQNDIDSDSQEPSRENYFNIYRYLGKDQKAVLHIIVGKFFTIFCET